MSTSQPEIRVLASRTADGGVAAPLTGGEPQTPAAIVARYQERVARLASRLLGWRSDVDDVVQDVFVSVLANLQRFRGESQLTTWIYRITVNECRRAGRRRALRERLRLVRREPPAAERELRECKPGEAIREAVRELPPTYRDVVVLRYLEELKTPEVAAILGVRPNVVDVRLNRARQRLRAALAGRVEV